MENMDAAYLFVGKLNMDMDVFALFSIAEVTSSGDGPAEDRDADGSDQPIRAFLDVIRFLGAVASALGCLPFGSSKWLPL